MTSQLFTWPSVRPVLLPPPVPSFEELERKTREAARAEGLAEGRRQADLELASRIRELDVLRQSLEQHRIELSGQQVSGLVEFVRGAFSALLGATLRINPEAFTTMLHQALESLPAGGNLLIRAHPELARSLAQMLDRTVEEDPSLPPFAVRVDADRVSWSADLLTEFNCLLEQGMSGDR